MTNLKNLTYKQLEKKVLDNRNIIRTTKDLSLKRRLINENHLMMTEMDRRLAASKI